MRKLMKVFLIIAVVLLAAKIWIIPELIRNKIQQTLSKFYDGSVQIKKIQVSSTGKAILKSVSLSDKTENKWLLIDDMKVTLVDWQILKPVISEIEISGLNLQISTSDGMLQLPSFHFSLESSETNKKPSLKKISIANAAVTIINQDGSDIKYKNLNLSAIRKDDIYQLQLNQTQTGNSEMLTVNGKINPQNFDFEASLQIRHYFTQDEINLPLAAMQIEGTTANGNLAGNMTITGNLNNPIQWQPKGYFQLRNWIIDTSGTTVQNILNTRIQIDPAGVHLRNLSIYDSNGDEWLKTSEVDVAMENWPGLNPTLEQIQITSPRLLIALDESGRLTIPSIPGKNEDTNSPVLPEIQKLAIHDAAVVVKKLDNSKVVFNKYSLEAEMQQDLYDITISRLSPEDSNNVLIKGTVKSDNLNVDLAMTVSDSIPTQQKEFIFELIKLPDFVSEGTFSTDLSIKGSITETIDKITTGTIRLNDWKIKGKNKQTISKFDTTISITEEGISLEDISVREPNEHEWLSIKNSKLIISEKPDSNMTLTAIELSDMKLRAQIKDSKLQLPVSLPMSDTTQKQNQFLDLQKILVQNASLSLTGPNIPETNIDNLWLELNKQQDYYNIQFARAALEDSNEIIVTAIFNPETSDLELSIHANTIVKSNEISVIQSLLNIPRFHAHGRMAADMNLSGNIKKIETLQPKGQIELKDWSVTFEDCMEINDIGTIIRLDNQKLSLENLVASDVNNTEWLSAKTTAIKLENWPGANPVITEIETEGLTLRTYLINDKLHLPVQLPTYESTGKSNKFIDIQKVIARNTTIDIANLNNKILTCDYFSIQPAEQEGFYTVLLIYTRPGQQKTSTVNLEGIVNPESLQVDLSLRMNHRATKQETAFIFAASGLTETSAEGSFVADMEITGNLNKPSSLQSSGSITIRDGILYVRDKILINNLKTTGKFNGKSLFFEQYFANICNGPAIGSLYIEAKQNKKIEIDGMLNADKMSFAELTSIFGSEKRKAAKGFVSLDYYFTSIEGNLKSLRGDGQIILDDGDISVIPIIPHLFSVMGLVKLDPLKLSDAQCAFGTAGPVMEIRSAHISNKFGAIEAEPGGTINLQTGNINMYVITIPLQQLDVLVRKIPLVDIFFNLRDKLTRFYIKGHWTSPPAKLISKTPVKDIKDGSVGFFKDVARNGGHFGQKMINGFESLLKATQNNKKQEEKQ